jgi:hypothetical protein
MIGFVLTGVSEEINNSFMAKLNGKKTTPEGNFIILLLGRLMVQGIHF